MFLGIFEGCSLFFEIMKTTYLHFKEKQAECYFIGELLSSEKEADSAFRQFIRDKRPEHLLFLRGNYQSIIRLSDQLWLFSDLGNVRPIYYMEQKKLFLFSSHLSILQKQYNSSLNLSWFLRSLSTGGFHIELETPYKLISAIPGGFGFSINNHGSRLFQAWNIDQEDFLQPDEAQKQLKEELTASVLLRCQGKRVTSDLSGGLDSSTITWIASKEQPVKSITIIGKEENEDGRIAREIVKERKNIEHVVFCQNEIPTIFSNIDQIHTDIPIPFYWSANREKKKISWAKANKSDIHFSGEGGDSVLGADFTYIVDLIHQGKWKTFISHAQGWADKKKQSPLTWINASIRLALQIPLPYNTNQRHPLYLINFQADWFNFPSSIKRGRFSKYQGVSNTVHDIHYLGYISHGLKDLADQEQVYLSFPYLDHNVIRVCMKVRLEDKMTPKELKPLLKKAFKNDLPQCLLNRNTKGDYTPDVYYGMKQNFSWFEENFQEMFLSEMGLVEIQKFRECFHRLAIGAPINLPEFQQTLSLELWLRQGNRSSFGRVENETIHS